MAFFLVNLPSKGELVGGELVGGGSHQPVAFTSGKIKCNVDRERV